MRTIKFKRTLSAATAAIMALSVLTGTMPEAVNSFIDDFSFSASADNTLNIGDLNTKLGAYDKITCGSDSTHDGKTYEQAYVIANATDTNNVGVVKFVASNSSENDAIYVKMLVETDAETGTNTIVSTPNSAEALAISAMFLQGKCYIVTPENGETSEEVVEPDGDPDPSGGGSGSNEPGGDGSGSGAAQETTYNETECNNFKVELADDCEDCGSFNIPTGKNVILDANGHKLTFGDSVEIIVDGELSVKVGEYTGAYNGLIGKLYTTSDGSPETRVGWNETNGNEVKPHTVNFEADDWGFNANTTYTYTNGKTYKAAENKKSTTDVEGESCEDTLIVYSDEGAGTGEYKCVPLRGDGSNGSIFYKLNWTDTFDETICFTDNWYRVSKEGKILNEKCSDFYIKLCDGYKPEAVNNWDLDLTKKNIVIDMNGNSIEFREGKKIKNLDKGNLSFVVNKKFASEYKVCNEQTETKKAYKFIEEGIDNTDHKMIKWFDEEGNVFDPETDLASLGDSETKKLTVKFISYSATFDSRGGSEVAEAVTDGESKITEPVEPEKKGYTFGGWYKDENCTEANKLVFEGDNDNPKKAIITENTTLYAKWTANEYSVKFDPNVAVAEPEAGSPVTGTMEDLKFTYDSAKNLTANAFAYPGHTFVEWNTEKDGTGTSYKDGQSVKNLILEDKGEVTLYAIWMPNDAYQITYDLDGGTIETPNPKFYTAETTDITLNSPTKVGYDFNGWELEGESVNGVEVGKNAKIDCGVASGNLTFKATWTAKTVQVTYKLSGSSGTEYTDSDNTWTSGKTETATYDSLLTPISPPEANDGYAFGGWYLDADNEGDIDSSESLFDLTKPIALTEPFTLIAKWNKVKAASAVDLNNANDVTGLSDDQKKKLGTATVSSVGADISDLNKLTNEDGQELTFVDSSGKAIYITPNDIKVKVAPVAAQPDEVNSKLDGALKDTKPEDIGLSVDNEHEMKITPLKSMNISLTADGKDPSEGWDNNVSMWMTVGFAGGDDFDLFHFTREGKALAVMHIPDNVGIPSLICGVDVQIINKKTMKFKAPGFSDFTIAAVEVVDKSTTPTTPGSHGSVDYETVTNGGITYHVYSDHAEVAEVDTATETAVIKDKVGGEKVTAIAENAFNSCTALKSVTIPATVETIEASAFWGCKALAEITIPENVTKIHKNAFSHCSALTTINGVAGSAAETFANANGYTFKDTSTPGTPETPDTDKLTATNVAIDKNGKVTWDAAEDAAEYKVFKKIGGKIYNTGWITKTEFTFDSIPTVNFEVYVASRNAGKSAVKYSEHVAVTGAKPLGTAANVKVTDAGKVTWTAAANAKYYKVVKVVNGKEYSKIVKTGTSTTISVPVSDYKVYVTAVGQYNTTTNSEIKDVTVKNALGYVNEVTVDKNGKVTWTKASNAVEYKVGKVMNGKTYWTKKVTGTSVTIKPAKKDYQVFVVAFNKDGKTSWGKKNLVEVGNLGTVLDPKVDANGNVTWTAARNAVKYKVGKTVNGKTYYTGELTTNSATIKVPKSDYKVFVVAFDKDGNKTWGTKADVKVK